MQKLSEVEARRHLDIGRSLATEAGRSIERTIAAGVEAYDRERHLPRLIRLGQEELADTRPAARRAILARLARALRSERTRGRAGHWTYDLNRHIGLKQAYAAESRMVPGSERRYRLERPIGDTSANATRP